MRIGSGRGHSRKRLEAVIAFTSLLAIVALLFPPWQYTFQAKGISQVRKPAGFGFLMAPPKPEENSPYWGISIDFSRLVSELFIIFAISGTILFLFYQKNQEHENLHSELPSQQNTTPSIPQSISRLSFPVALQSWGVLIKNSINKCNYLTPKNQRLIGIGVAILITSALFFVFSWPFASSSTNMPAPSPVVAPQSEGPISKIPEDPLKPGITYLYTYCDKDGRLVINNLPPSSMKGQGLVLKHVGVGKVRLATTPETPSESKPK